MSIRRGAVSHQWPSAGLDQLGEHPAGRLRVQERHAAAADAAARLLVDQPQPGVAHCVERGSMSSVPYAMW